MKKILAFVFVFTILNTVGCNAQPKSTYTIKVGEPVAGAVKYHYFLEKKSTTQSLTQGMDYLNPNVSNLEIGSNAKTSFDVELKNDGSEYVIGVVAEDSAGYYSAMGIGAGSVGKVPNTPALITLIKK